MSRNVGRVWLPLDVRFATHPKVSGLSDGAFRLHVAALLYCRAQMTDGLVPADMLAQLMPRYRPTYVGELTRRLLWVDVGADHYEIHDYLQHNASRADVERMSEKRRAAARRRWEE